MSVDLKHTGIGGDEERIYLDTNENDLDNERITVENAMGYGGCHVIVGCHIMTWEAFDQLKVAMQLAETLWRKP